jgi:hypothetical protein
MTRKTTPAPVDGADVIGFYRELGHELPNTASEFAPVPCLTHPERHKRGDRNKSAGVSLTSGVHTCRGCGTNTSPYAFALGVVGSRKAAWDLCVKYRLRTPNVTQVVRSNDISYTHFVNTWVTLRSEGELLELLAAYRRGETHAEPVDHPLPEEANEFERRYAAVVALLLGLLRGGGLMLSRRTALKVMGLEPTEGNASRIRRANERFAKWRTFEVGKAERVPGVANATTTFKALSQKRPSPEASLVTLQNDGGPACDPNSKPCSALTDAGPSPSPAPSKVASTATTSPTRAVAMLTAGSSVTSSSGWEPTLSERDEDWSEPDGPEADDGLGSAWSDNELQRLVDDWDEG